MIINDIKTCSDIDLAQACMMAQNEVESANRKYAMVITEINRRAENEKQKRDKPDNIPSQPITEKHND